MKKNNIDNIINYIYYMYIYIIIIILIIYILYKFIYMIRVLFNTNSIKLFKTAHVQFIENTLISNDIIFMYTKKMFAVINNNKNFNFLYLYIDKSSYTKIKDIFSRFDIYTLDLVTSYLLFMKDLNIIIIYTTINNINDFTKYTYVKNNITNNMIYTSNN